MTPCLAIGGDFFEYGTQPDGGVTFAVGDVAGKGTSAALLTAVVQGLFSGEAETEDPPGHVLARINRALCRRVIESRFVTAFYGQVGTDGMFRYCNAGHNAPFLMTAVGAERLETGGLVLGLFDVAQYQTGATSVKEGDLLVLFSDGVTEAVNPAGEEFGDERLARCLERVRGLPARDVLEAVQQAVHDFCGGTPPRDDVTVMAVRFL
jgi:sigma-B regulation protein RsbU (phosphoserine phosphatase)